MKNTINSVRHLAMLAIALGAGAIGVIAQNSMPAPGSGGSFNPSPPNGIGWNPRPGISSSWGNPWGPGWSSYNPVMPDVPLASPDWQNTGVTNVISCGYDAMGVWRTVPLNVSYNYNGVQYDVTVINAWNPWTSSWDTDMDVPAVNTSYYLNGQTFDFYAVLSTGTFYFNL